MNIEKVRLLGGNVAIEKIEKDQQNGEFIDPTSSPSEYKIARVTNIGDGIEKNETITFPFSKNDVIVYSGNSRTLKINGDEEIDLIHKNSVIAVLEERTTG